MCLAVTGVGCACPSGGASCEGTCTDVASDEANCGACAVVCPGRLTCVGGACTCTDGCGPTCADTRTDPEHCGACGRACASGGLCVDGRCSCPSGTVECDGVCAALTEPEHCGACGRRCPEGGACFDGTCTCPAPSTLACEGVCIDSELDDENCGACGNRCTGATFCGGGACRCPRAGDTFCGGACVDLLGDEGHCGACGRNCTAPTTCFDGACSCGPGRTVCGPECADLMANTRHCGDCGVACATGGACSGGTCRPSLLWNFRIEGGTDSEVSVGDEDGRVALRDGELFRAHAARYGGALFALHDASTGAVIWRRTAYAFGARIGAVAIDDDGRIAIVATFQSRWTSPGGTTYVLPPSVSFGVVALVLDHDGNLLFDYFVPGNGEAGGVAFLSTGELVVTGTFAGTQTLGSTTVFAGSDDDLFVAVLDTAGAVVRARDFGRGGSEYHIYLAVTADDDLLLAGRSGAGIDFGGGLLDTVTIHWAARLGAHFEHRWSRILPVEEIDGVATTPSGQTLVSGVLDRVPNFGNGVALTVGDGARFLLALDASGTALWASGEGTRYGYRSGGIAVAEDGHIFSLATYAVASSDTPFPFMTSLALVAYDASGRRLWYRAWGTPSTTIEGTGIAAEGDLVAFAGHPGRAPLDLGLGPMAWIDQADIFYAVVRR